MDTSATNKQLNQTPRRGETVNFAELLQIVKFRRKLIYAFTALALTGAVLKQVLYVPTYMGEATLTIQRSDENPLQAALANISSGGFDSSPEKLQRYINYLNSYEFFLAVAENLKFHEGYHQLNLTPPWEMSVGGKKFWKHLLSTKLGTPQSTSSTDNNPEPELVPVESLANFIMSVTTATTVGAESIKLKVTTLDPVTSMVLANTAAETFVKKTTERDYNEVSEVKRFIQQQLDSTTERLKRSELALVEFKKRHNIISIDAEHAAYSTKLGTLDQEIESNKVKFDENKKLIDYYENALDRREKAVLTHGSAAVTTSAADVAARLRQQLDSLRYKKVLMQAQGYAEDSWQMSEINGDIDKVAAQLKEELNHPGANDEDLAINVEAARSKVEKLKTENRSLESKIQALEKSRNELMKGLGSLPQDEQVLLTLKRDTDLQFELYSMLKKKLQEVEIQQVALQSRVNVIQQSDLPQPVARTGLLIKIVFALLVGIFLGSTLAFFLEAVDPTVKHRSDLESFELVALGNIPHMEGSPIRRNLGSQSYRPDLLVCKEIPESPESMAFKHLRTQLSVLRGSEGKLAKVISITSPDRGEGKSFIASNLAVAFSQLEKRTLLIDCDLRNPSLPWLFGYKSGDGLSSLLTLKSALDDVLIRSWMPELDILPAGWTPPNPTELVSHDKFRILMDHLRSVYDYIIIDSTPAVSVADASILASLSDVTVLVSSYRKTRKDSVLAALKRILQISHKQVYSVLNDVYEASEFGSFPYPTMETPGGGGPGSPNDVDLKTELKRFEEALGRRAS